MAARPGNTLLSLLPLFLYATGADGRTWYIEVDGTGDAPTIRAAMDSARTGDEVVVGAGRFTWTSEGAGGDHSMIHMKSDVLLRSESGPELTILDAEDVGRVILVRDAGNARVEGFTIQHGLGLPVEGIPFYLGGGILSTGASQPTISNCVIRNNAASGAGGISSGPAVITDCKIVGNQAGIGDPGFGGGAACEGATISGCVFTGNFVFGLGGGLVANNCTVTDCVFESNRAQTGSGASGGGVCAAQGTAFERCTFRNNVVLGPSTNASGSGLRVDGDCRVTESVFVGNIATGANVALGAAIGVFKRCNSCPITTAIIERCTIIANKASAGFGTPVGGIYSGPGTDVRVSSTIVAWNTGSGIDAAPAEISCTNAFGNTAGDILAGMDAGGNFGLDPQFCSVDPVAAGDFTLQEDSPCAPGSHPAGQNCGLIGAAPVQCGSVGVERRTWGDVKSLYRRREP